ncbi:DUF2460 domain-containing protein [Acinetobacter baumannii]|uniref:DUF2460 domain-containing protein n=2 Tax=Acinetobacter baumannii TaxID=470 RepID=UPI000DE687AF|nr:DUF2460 domain-containing protein [Acinetobacter baumannii]CAH1069475.1 Uncharacterised protein [Acinetobacter phage MD-2021a]SSR47180.1 Uncharacterised protein [Acinetobacter baumannii]SSR60155.1 Uncharacterised protein [Acinetobacter baumannii]SSR61320.1 Uncharacterised protein [Acinetobacter baumannii]SSR73543.1 Uncharacterised protein [Acinetobacter baumannii]
MAVPEQTPFIEYTANGTTTVYPLTFDCDKSEYLIVSLDGEEAPVGSWSLTGGSITFNTAPANGVLITIERNTPFRRTTEYQSYNNSFRPSAVNKDFDLIWWKLQELGYRDQVIWLALVKEIADRISGDVNLQNQINTIDKWLDNLQQNVNENTNDIAQLVTDLSKEIADRIANDEALKEMFLAMMDEAINEGTINALAITHLDSWEALESVTNVWDGRTIYVKDLGNYCYDALTTSWVKAYQDTDNVKDGAETQKQINAAQNDLNNKTIQSVNCVADISNFKPRKNGQIIYLKSYYLGKATGWGYLEYDQTSVEVANNVTTFTSSYGGIWRRQQKDQKEIYAVDGGALFDGVTDNTEAYRRICAMLTSESTLRLSHGTSLTHYFELPALGCKIVGADLTHSTIKLIDATDYIGWKEYNFFENFRITGKGVFEAGSYLFRDTRTNKDTKADCDIFWKNCYFSEAEFITDGFGRGFKFDNCQDYNIRYAWVKADFPVNFIPNGTDNDTLETGFRGFVFTNNRRHYSPAYFLWNLGYNAANLQGVQITDTWLEGGGRFIVGKVKDAVITGTCGYHRNADWKYLELTGGENISITGNTFAKMRGNTTVENAFITSANAIKGLIITGNAFHGIDQEIVRLAHSGETSQDITIANNTYQSCFSTGAGIFNITSGAIDGITVKESGVVAPNSSWIPVRRSAGLSVANHKIDVNCSVSPYVHNFSRGNSLGSSRKQGIYNGTGNTATQTIVVGYEPRNIRVTGSDGTICILPYGTNTLANGLAIGTAQDFTATGNANKSGVTYFWESD